MRGYGQFCPVAIASEVFAERWTPLIIRELFCGSHRFNELLTGLPRIPRSILVQRLRTLETVGVVERKVDASRRGVEYHLTQAGVELGDVVLQLGDWGQRWANVDIASRNLDPDLLMWDIHRRLESDRLPDGRVVVQVDLTGAHQKSYWLVLERPLASVCWTDPGFDVDLMVNADSVTLHRIWMGKFDLALALRDGLVELDGPAELRRAFPEWLAVEHFRRPRRDVITECDLPCHGPGRLRTWSPSRRRLASSALHPRTSPSSHHPPGSRAPAPCRAASGR